MQTAWLLQIQELAPQKDDKLRHPRSMQNIYRTQALEQTADHLEQNKFKGTSRKL